MSALMIILWQSTDKTYYKPAFTKSIEAVYEGSDLKSNVERVNDRIKEKYPKLSAVAPIGYAIGVRRQVHFTSSKVSPIPNTVTTYDYDHASKSGSVRVSWRF